MISFRSLYVGRVEIESTSTHFQTHVSSKKLDKISVLMIARDIMVHLPFFRCPILSLTINIIMSCCIQGSCHSAFKTSEIRPQKKPTHQHTVINKVDICFFVSAVFKLDVAVWKPVQTDEHLWRETRGYGYCRDMTYPPKNIKRKPIPCQVYSDLCCQSATCFAQKKWKNDYIWLLV